MNLINNPHLGLEPPKANSVFLIRGPLKYYHYACDNFDDRGWGCGYRTLQSVLSWIIEAQKNTQLSAVHSSSVPSILDIQKALVEMGDKTESFMGSKQWIGSVEVSYCIEHFCKILGGAGRIISIAIATKVQLATMDEVESRIIHSRDVDELKQHVEDIANHFREFGSPIMMGGDHDCSSKGILGISIAPGDIKLLILDPHYSGSAISREKLQAQGWIKWQDIDSLDHSSFYNLCCPLIKAGD